MTAQAEAIGAPILRCAPAAELRGDAAAATATPVTRWLLVEQSGPWGRDAARSCGLSLTVAEDLLDRADVASARLLLIRRYGRPVAGPRRWAYVDSRPGLEASYWGSVGSDDELLRVPLDGSAGTRRPGPTYLVCTHGRHDACCAIRGRPVAARLSALRPAETWECSHVGGDRFAANLVLLPHGLFYGQVTAADAAGIIEAYEERRVVPELLRGRSTFSTPVQAAQHHARLALGERDVDGLAPRGVHRLGAATWQVRLAAADGPVTVTVAAEKTRPAPLTCSATRDVVATTFRLVSLTSSPS